MNVNLTPHAAELLEAVRAQRMEPVELIVERALEAWARDHHIEREAATGETRAEAVREMLDFVKRNRVRLEADLSVKDLIHEGHRV